MSRRRLYIPITRSGSSILASIFTQAMQRTSTSLTASKIVSFLILGAVYLVLIVILGAVIAALIGRI